jgi:hypothetical protein
LQDLPDGDVYDDIPDASGPDIHVLGRCFAVYFNQLRVGRVEITPDHDEYTTGTPQVYTRVQVKFARFLGYGPLTKFLEVIEDHVTKRGQECGKIFGISRAIQYALAALLWKNYTRPDDYDEDLGELDVRFHGAADWYIRRRGIWRQNAATNTKDAS